MENNFKKAINKIKSKWPVFIIIWVILAVIFVGPIAVVLIDAQNSGGNIIKTALDEFTELMKNPFSALEAAFKNMQLLGQTFLYYTIIYIVGIIFLTMKSMPKSEYDKIEHGSSDWCEGGEQYQVLSAKTGIVLSDKNYLPVDKRGNVNILVIRRFWSR